MAGYNTARHFNIDHLVGSIAPGRYADVVLLRDIEKVQIDRVYANGKLAASIKTTITNTYYPFPKLIILTGRRIHSISAKLWKPRILCKSARQSDESFRGDNGTFLFRR